MVVGLVAAAATAFALWVSERMIYPPALGRGLADCPPPVQRAFRYCRDPHADLGLAFEEVSFPTPDGLTLRGWLLAPQRHDGATVVFVHGAGRDRREGLRYLPFLHERGFGVLLFDLRNHGLSDDDGRGLSYGAREQDDVRGAVRFLAARGDTRVAVIAGGVGAASAVLAAADEPGIETLVLESPFTDFDSFARDALGRTWGLPGPLARLVALVVSLRRDAGRVAPIDVIGRLAPRPVLTIHGTDDALVPVDHGRALHERAGEPKELWIVNGGQHAALFDVQPDAYGLRVGEFLERALALPAPAGR